MTEPAEAVEVDEYDMIRTHRWVGGMCYVHADDIDGLSSEARKRLECERCDSPYPPMYSCPSWAGMEV